MYCCYSEIMRASRLLSLLMLLQTRGRMSAPALAAVLEVSPRTILRDIDELSAAGVPVWADRGRDGGFVLQAGWSTELTGLTEAEAQGLFLAGLPKAATELGLGHAAASAHLKMLTALPAALRADAQRVSARLHIDPLDWYRAATPPAYLPTVADAVWQQRTLRIRYESWTGVRERLIQPLGLVLKAGVWYAVALVDGHREPRSYRLANIQQAATTGQRFRPPKGFDLARHWQRSTARFEAGLYTDQATLRLSAEGLRRLREFSAVVAEAALRSATVDGEPPGWQRVTIPIESIHHAADLLLGLAAEVEVLQPPALRQRVRQQLRATAARYGD